MRNCDPIFNLPQPAFFAHRGGAAEAPESTIESFLYALGLGANIIEVDIQLSKDGVPVVWHGPELDITIHEAGKSMIGKYVSCWDYNELSSKLLVRYPEVDCKNENMETYEKRDDQGQDRHLISLERLVGFVKEVKEGRYDGELQDGKKLGERPVHLNLELKKTSREGDCDCEPSWTEHKVTDEEGTYPYLRKVFNILNAAPEDVTIVVGSADHEILCRFRDIQNGKYITNLSAREQLAYAGQFEPSRIDYIGKLGPIPKILLKVTGWLVQLFYEKKKDLSKFAFEAPSAIVSDELVDEVHKHRGGIYVFLSPFPFMRQAEEDYAKKKRKEDERSDEEYCEERYREYKERVKELLNMGEKGVDGLMSDYPAVLNRVLQELGYPQECEPY